MDGVISTAAVPGPQAPLLIIEDAVKRMKPGSVIVDLAAETGGNCELTEAGETVVEHDVKIVGAVNLPATMPDHASQLYAKNVAEPGRPDDRRRGRADAGLRGRDHRGRLHHPRAARSSTRAPKKAAGVKRGRRPNNPKTRVRMPAS